MLLADDGGPDALPAARRPLGEESPLKVSVSGLRMMEVASAFWWLFLTHPADFPSGWPFSSVADSWHSYPIGKDVGGLTTFSSMTQSSHLCWKSGTLCFPRARFSSGSIRVSPCDPGQATFSLSGHPEALKFPNHSREPEEPMGTVS